MLQFSGEGGYGIHKYGAVLFHLQGAETSIGEESHLITI
jgi:hypothetical protein